MKCQKENYPYSENDVFLVISGLDMDYALSSSDSGSFTLSSCCMVSRNARCVRERKECFLNDYEKIYAIYSLSELKQWREKCLNKQSIITLSKDNESSSFWYADYQIDDKLHSHPHIFKASSAVSVFYYLLRYKGVIPFFIKENTMMESVIMTMEDICYGLYPHYEYVSDFYNNEDEYINKNLPETQTDLLKKLDEDYQNIIRNIKT